MDATNDTACYAMSEVQRGTSDFEMLFRGHYRRVCRLVYRVVGSQDVAEELASEAFWRLHQKGLASVTTPEAWVCRTAAHLALDRLRKDRRRLHYEAASPSPEDPATPEEAVSHDRQAAMVREVLAVLNPRRSALLLMRAEGLTYRELAVALDLNPASVGTMMARAERAFKKEYEKRYGQR